MHNDFDKYLEHPELLDERSLPKLKQLVGLYPSFQAAWMLLLKNLKNLEHPDFDKYLKKGAIRVSSRKQLYFFLFEEKEQEMKPEDLLENEYVAQSSYQLTDDSYQEEESLSSLVRSIQKKGKQEPPVEVEDNPPNEFVTETLAKIYAKQGLYREAIHAYEKLSLKYPEKNTYFAGRIQEIKKLTD